MPEKSRNETAPVLVTGASGLIGKALCARLEELGYVVLGLDLDPDIDYVCDLTDPDNIARTLKDITDEHGGKFHAVVHLAAYFDFTGEPHPLYRKLNVDGTRHLLRALADHHVDRFVYASTMLVHAPTEPGVPISECSPLEARWSYPASKLDAETALTQTIEAMSDSGETPAPMPYSILRLAGLYHDDCGSPTLGNQIKRVYEKELTSRLYAGDPATGQSFIHLDDAVDALVRTVEKARDLPADHVVLIGEETVMSYQALNNAISMALHGEPLAVAEVPGSPAKLGAELQRIAEKVIPDSIDQGDEPFIRRYMIDLASDHYEIDATRARETLGFRTRHRLADELPKILERLRRDPLKFYERNSLQPPHWMTRFGNDDNPNRWREKLGAVEAEEHRQFLWAHLTTLGLGAWLIATPVTVAVTDPRLAGTEMLAGAVIMVASLLALSRELAWARWLSVFAALVVAGAPLVFWTPSAAAYLNDTLVGLLVACLALGARPVLGVGIAARADPSAIPENWDFSPSTWLQRLPIVALAFVGLCISRYLAAFQLGQTEAAWDPFFGTGTERIITSDVSKAWPVADAGLGAYVYLLEILSGVVGSQRRWRTMPWLVLFFGFLIVPLGAVSIYFIIIQPIVIGTWCTLCLIAAAAMVLQIPYSFDEILASLQFIRQRVRQGESWLRVLLLGDALAEPNPASKTGDGSPAGEVPRPAMLETASSSWLREMLTSGLSAPWTLLLSAVLGVALMFSRLIAGTDGALADSDHLIGSLVIVVSISALAEVARPLRLINMLLGVALIGAPFILEGGNLWSVMLDVVAGSALIGLAVPRGAIGNRYGDLDRFLI
ncbi:MAG: NAD-dependent epimerase/dehydratase family protein [Pseudomonadales bacterium]